MEKYDAIIVGSGMGGLTTGALLSKMSKKRVLILEQHSKMGGLTHEFKRVVDGKSYTWDVGLHYVGQLGKGTLTRKIFDYITDGNLKWTKMTDKFDHFVYPDFKFTESSDPNTYKADLIEKFPLEKKAINRYFKDLKRGAKWYVKDCFINYLPKWMSIWLMLINSFSKKVALSTTQEYMDQHFKDEKLKALLCSQWGDYGLPPNESSFAIHALVLQNYMTGAYFPDGGSEQIAKNILPVLKRNGGDCLVNHPVSEIIIENGKAIGVKVNLGRGKKKKEKIFYADVIISNAGAVNTFTKMLPQNWEHSKLAEITNIPKGNSACTLFIALKDDPRKLGLKGENYWIYDGYNHNEVVQDLASIKEGKIRYAYLSFPSIKNSLSTSYTAEILTMLPYDIFEDWKNETWMNRAEEYTAFKEKLAKNYLDLIEKHVKGFKDMVVYSELSTPLTIEHFTKRKNGEMYGVAATPQRHNYTWLKPKTEIENLYLTGSDVCSLGIQGALFGGLGTTIVLNGSFGLFKIMRGIKANK